MCHPHIPQECPPAFRPPTLGTTQNLEDMRAKLAVSGNRMKVDGAGLWPLEASTIVGSPSCQGLPLGFSESLCKSRQFPWQPKLTYGVFSGLGTFLES